MKTYNVNSVLSHGFRLSTRSYCNTELDKQLAKDKKLDALDFCLWFDNQLLDIKDVSFKMKPFDFILKLVDLNYINSRSFFSNSVKSNFRIACLIFAKFVKCDANNIHSIREEFLKDYPHFFDKKEEVKINYDELFKYDRYKANKLIFLYAKNNGISKTLMSELVSRQLVAFDEKGHNIVYVCTDCFDFQGIERHGIGTKHFMKLEGTPFPFVYYKERFDRVSNDKFVKVEVFDTSLVLLQYLSDDNIDIYDDVLYVSMHTSNYNKKAFDNLKNVFGDLPATFHFDNSAKEDFKPLPEEDYDEDIPF